MFLRDKENRLMLSSSRHKPKTVDDSQPKVYNSYTCGECYEKIPYFRENPEALRLIIYNDDAEPCNTLSSRAGNSKIAAMYFKIQNIPLHFNSSKKAVFPLIYAKTMDAKRHGYNKVLGPLVDDLKRLEKGVPVYYGSEVYILKAAVIALAGDTLAVHDVFGLLGPSSSQFCRECTISRQQFKANPLENNFPLKDEKWYDINLDKLRNKQITPKDCGLKVTGCILNELAAFHVMENHAFDVMHDLAEGIIPVTVQLVLATYYRNKKLGLNIDYINYRIRTFNYGFHDRKNKPSPNVTTQMLLQPNTHRMRQTASQYLLLLRAFPFLFGHKVPGNCQYMGLISVLINITRIAFSPTIPDFLLAELEMDIKVFHNTFFSLFSRHPNKLHHLYHYPDCIKKVGPLVQFDCRVFEGKNKDIKSQMKTACNYKNVCFSLAKRQVFAQTVAIAERPFQNRLEYKSGKMCLVNDLQCAHLIQEKNVDRYFVTKGINYNGVHFRPGCLVSMKGKDFELSVFGVIQEIIVINSAPRFYIQIWEVMGFDTVLQAYEVQSSEELDLVGLDAVHCYATFSVWKVYNQNTCFISRKIYNDDCFNQRTFFLDQHR